MQERRPREGAARRSVCKPLCETRSSGPATSHAVSAFGLSPSRFRVSVPCHRQPTPGGACGAHVRWRPPRGPQHASVTLKPSLWGRGRGESRRPCARQQTPPPHTHTHAHGAGGVQRLLQHAGRRRGMAGACVAVGHSPTSPALGCGSACPTSHAPALPPVRLTVCVCARAAKQVLVECGHMFCGACLARHWQSARRRDQGREVAPCPVCRVRSGQFNGRTDGRTEGPGSCHCHGRTRVRVRDK